MDEPRKPGIKRIVIGSIRRKLLLGFSLVLALMVAMALLTYDLNVKISNDATDLKDVEAPLQVMVEQVIGYDGILTSHAYAALLHAEKGDKEGVEEHKRMYDEVGAKLDSLLKVDARTLLAKSDRPAELAKKVDGYLKRLDEINLKLVDLEMGAFAKMEQGDTDGAYALIVSEQYDQYKGELAQLYRDWADVELEVSQLHRVKVLENSQMVGLINVAFAVLSILVGILIAFMVSHSISKPVSQLHDAAMQLEKGDFSSRVIIKTSDELEDLGKSLNKAIEALGRVDDERKQMDKVKTEFLSITSHELRSPMTPMRAQLQMLQEGYFGKMNDKQKESVDIILRNTTRLDNIIQDFLEISRIEAARLKFTFIKTSLKPYIARLTEEMQAFLPEKKIALSVNIGQLPEIEMDPDRTMQVLRNLMTNAIKFTPDGGKMTVNVEAKNDQIFFSVRDTGIGIAKENQARIFEPFFQEEQTMYRKYSGTGLGLAICRGIVESQGGKIWFESEQGKGTTFFFTIPLEPVRDAKPIKVLFSPQADIEKKLMSLFIEYLGPLGKSEFEQLKGGKGIVIESLSGYLDELLGAGILTKQAAELFRAEIMRVLK